MEIIVCLFLPFIRRSLNFFGKIFLFLSLFLCYPFFGTFPFHVVYLKPHLEYLRRDEMLHFLLNGTKVEPDNNDSLIFNEISPSELLKMNLLTPWYMEPGGSMPHSQKLSNNSYPKPNQPIFN